MTFRTLDLAQGIYRNEQVADYDAIDAINYSSLKLLARSPRHYQHYLEHGARETRDMFKGSAAHACILEPERFERDFVVYDGDRRAGKKWEEFETANATKTILKKDEMLEALRIRDAVRADPLASSYLSNGMHEVTLVWVDPETGLKLKGRVDWLRADWVNVDVKTTRDATPLCFSRDVARLMYHVQAAMYQDGLEVITGNEARTAVIAVEKHEPHDCVVFSMPEATIDAGRNEYRRLLGLLAECRQGSRWPGIGNGFEVPLTLPWWALDPDSDDVELTIGGQSFTV